MPMIKKNYLDLTNSRKNRFDNQSDSQYQLIEKGATNTYFPKQAISMHAPQMSADKESDMMDTFNASISMDPSVSQF